MDIYSEAYSEGEQSRKCGWGPTENPYKSGSKESYDWLAGWWDQDYYLELQARKFDSWWEDEDL